MPQDSILRAIGGTSCFRLNRISRAKAKLFVKPEYLSPGRGMSDRFALSLIEQLESTGSLKTGDTIICVGDGQWELSLAFVGAQKGLNLAVVHEADADMGSNHHLHFMRAVVLRAPTGQSAQAFALATANERHWHYLQTDYLPQDSKNFFDTTVFELLDDFSEEQINYLIIPRQIPALADLMAEQIRRVSPATWVIFSELDDSTPYTQHLPIPPDLLHPSLVGQAPIHVPVSLPLASDGCKTAMHKEGMLVGRHSGAALAVALYATEHGLAEGNIAIILSDAPHVKLDVTALAQVGSPAYQEIDHILGVTHTENPRSASTDPLLPVMDVQEEDALMADVTLEMLKQLISSPGKPVVMFGLEWCEFCWAVRKLFRRLSIPVHNVDLDSSAYRPARLGSKMRAALSAYTGSSGLPQIFIGGEFIGSHLELFDIVSNRSLFRKLDEAGINYNRVLDIDPYTLLPGWTHTPTHSA